MEWSVGDVFKRGLKGMEIRTASGTEDKSHGAGAVLCFLPAFLGCKGQVKNEYKVPYIQVKHQEVLLLV